MHEFDVIICGAGPAGSTCALGLFKAGLNVALFDKSSFPREKICGDAYGGYCSKILNTISPRFGERLKQLNNGNITNRAKLVSPSGKQFTLDLKGFYANLPRDVLDNFLLDMVRTETKTSFFLNTGIKTVKVNADHVIAATDDGEQIKAKMIVGCDGVHSVVQSALTGTRELLTEACPAMRGYYKNVKGMEPDCIEIHFLKEVPKGYFWIFPTVNGLANVGIGADKDALKKHQINLRKTFHELVAGKYSERFKDAQLIGEVKGWTIPIGYFKGQLSISGNRLILCGDAAAIVDPATGEGIGPAMSSGRYAALQVIRCFEKGDFSEGFMKQYDRNIRQKYYRPYFIRSAAADLYYTMPRLMNFVIGLFARFK